MTDHTPKRRKFILLPAGSAGDVHPFLWLAQGLQARAHEVCAVVHPPFGNLFHEARIRTVSYGTTEDYEDVIRHPDLWHPRRGFALIARNAERLYRLAVPLISEEIAPGRTTLVGAGIAFGARIAAEAYRLPLVTIQLQPAVFFSVLKPPLFRAGWEWFARAPRWLRRLLYRLAYWQTDWLLAEDINEFRSELGSNQPVRRILRDYWMSPQRIVALFPDWYGPRQPDWPPHSVTTRFPFDETASAPALSGPVEEFLAEGGKPILFTPGSANIQCGQFFRVALETAQRLGQRALFVSPARSQIPSALPRSVRQFDFVPFRALFPRCAAVVHHGGIGTVAQGLLAGIPQLIMAMSHDQPDNGARLRQFGVGDYLYPKQFLAAEVAARLRRLTVAPEVARHCREYRQRMLAQPPADRVFELLEQAAGTHLGHPRSLAPPAGSGRLTP